MDTRKIGGFLKALRKEKGLTQEQLAEILLVSGRTVSRWETGTNMPDLSILIQMAEFYQVEVREILEGEKKSDSPDSTLKETLCAVADYNKLEKEKTLQAGNAAFVVTFAACAVTILIQLATIRELSMVLGETVTLLAGGIAYIIMMLRNGPAKPDGTFKDTLIGLLCSLGATVVFVLRSIRLGVSLSRIPRMALLFFAGITALGFALMKALDVLNRKIKKK